MKILRISLRNLASLEGTHTVDFTREPLRSAGLFSISGATGSGKSTLLDALCLALYDATPRLRVVGRLAEMAGGERQNDPRNLLRRGTGEGFAEVAFVGVDEATYTARWAARRARHRPDGPLQNTEMTLFRGDVPPGVNGAIEQGGKKTEVLLVIAAKIGLSFEQFTRAVLLAQNDFAAFLKADDKDRAEILQALTGTQRFEAISRAVFARCSAEQSAVSDLAGRIEGNAPLTPEARLEAEIASASAEGAWREAGEKLAAREGHALWFRRCAELSRQADAAAVSLREKGAARDAAGPRRGELDRTEEASRAARPLRDAGHRLRAETAAAEKSRDAAAKAEAAAQADHAAKTKQSAEAAAAFDAARAAFENAKPHLLQARELDAKLAPLADRLAAATRDREAAEAGVKQVAAQRDALRTRRETAEVERTPLMASRHALAAFAAFAPEAAAWLHRLDRAAECRQAFAEAESKLAQRVGDEAARSEQAATARAQEAAVRAAAMAAAAAFTQAETSAKAHDGEKISQARSQAQAAHSALRDLANHLVELETVTVRAITLETEIAGLKTANDAGEKALAELQQRQIPHAERACSASRRAFDLAEAAVTDEAIRLREKLVEDEPCPVCGASEHPHAAHPPAAEAAALRALRTDCAARENELHQLRERAAGLRAARVARLEQEAEKKVALVPVRTQLAAFRTMRHEHPAAAAILALPETERAAALAAQLTAQQQTLRAADTADAARRAAEKLRDDRRAQRERATADLDALEKRLAGFAGELATLRVAREAAAATRAQAEKALHLSLEALAPLFADPAAARSAWHRDAPAFRKGFAEKTAAFLALEKRLQELGAVIRETEAALLPATEALTRAGAEQGAKRSAEASARAAHDAVRTQRAAIFAGRPVEEVEKAFAGTFQRALEMRDLRNGEFDRARHHFTAAAGIHQSAGVALAGATTRQTAAATALDSWLAGFAARIGRPFDRVELDALLARDDAWIQAERRALDTLEGAVRTAEGALAVHQKTLDEHVAARPTADDEPTVMTAVAELRTAHAEAAQRRDAARAFLMADEQRIARNADLARQLSERRAIAEPWIKLNELIGSADGAKFRGIAQRRTLDLLLGYANAQLDDLSARYRLERLPESLNLLVIDRDMGDERRSVHSLSGGESFLISLALALALASLTSNRLRIESLFIDEGFGSLDPETLHVAMNALMRLEAQGRKVGVISHVAEMTDAIPVQIRVVKGRSGASRLLVPGAAMTPDFFAKAGADPAGQPRAEADPSAIQKIAAQILDILQREHALGRTRISVRGLRAEIGCSASELSAAREILPGRVQSEGRSLFLV